MDHSWVIFPFDILGSNHNIKKKKKEAIMMIGLHIWLLELTLRKQWPVPFNQVDTKAHFLFILMKQLTALWQLLTDDPFTL